MGDVETFVENDLIYLKFSSYRAYEILGLNIVVPKKGKYEIIFCLIGCYSYYSGDL